MQKRPKILHHQIVANTQIFQIEKLHLQFENGQERHYERIKGSKEGAVMIAPMLDEDTVLLIREYGVGVEDYFLGLPKGIIEANETVLAAANREIMEEVGYGARQLTLLKPLSLSPGYMTRTMSLVLARELYPHQLVGDEPEPIEVVPWRLSQLNQLLARDDFHEARSIAALFMIRELLHHG